MSVFIFFYIVSLISLDGWWVGGGGCGGRGRVSTKEGILFSSLCYGLFSG